MISEPHFDGCEIVKKLRSGPATVCYLARQTSLGRPVVIKALSPNVLPDSAFAEPLAREAQTLSRLRHKNIVQLYDFVQRDTRMWQVLEYVEGFTLDELLQQIGQLSIGGALAIALKLTQTLEYVHSHGVVHCDIQPKNVIVSKEGEVKLSNFYLAAAHNAPAPPELLEGDSGFASPSYLSPEQVLGETADARSDLFSVGVLLYELITAKRPFDAEDNRSTAQRIRHEHPIPLSQSITDVPPVVERLINRALSKLPADRFSDATELVRVLEHALAQLGHRSAQDTIRRALSSGDLPPSQPSQPKPIQESPDERPVFAALRLYAVVGALAVGGVSLIAYLAHEDSAPNNQKTSLELLPDNAANLRVVARPWAHVFVDGQQVATTPFATPIPLSPGTHYVRFDHPKAPSEHRTLTVHPSQTIFLDVALRTPRKADHPTPFLTAAPRAVDGGTLSP